MKSRWNIRNDEAIYRKDEEYLKELEQGLDCAMKEIKPDFVLYDAGVDIFEGDSLGRLKISEDGIRKRDRFVLERCITANVPVVGVIGGGYDKDVYLLAKRHAILFEEAAKLWRKHRLWMK